MIQCFTQRKSRINQLVTRDSYFCLLFIYQSYLTCYELSDFEYKGNNK